MAWENRGKRRYYYKGVRVGKKVRKIYLGKGPAAALEADAVGLRRRHRRLALKPGQALRESYGRSNAAVGSLSDWMDLLTKAELVAAGYHKHGGEWRRRCFMGKGRGNMITSAINSALSHEHPTPDNGPATPGTAPRDDQAVRCSEPDACDNMPNEGNDDDAQKPDDRPSLGGNREFRALVEQANSGDAEAVQRLRDTLIANPAVWQKVGDLAAHAEQMLIRLIGGTDRLLAESLEIKLKAMKQELLGEAPSTLEKLAVERIVACWAQLQFADASAISAKESGSQKFWAQEQARADRRYQAAIKQVLHIRQMLPSKSRPAGRTSDSEAKHVASHEPDRPAGCNGRSVASHPSTTRSAGRPGTQQNGEQSRQFDPVHGEPVARILPFARTPEPA